MTCSSACRRIGRWAATTAGNPGDVPGNTTLTFAFLYDRLQNPEPLGSPIG